MRATRFHNALPLIFGMAVWLFAGSLPLAPRPSTGIIKTLVIDAGHGGKDPGTSGISSKEKNITLAIATELSRIVKENYPSIKVIMTRTSDVFVELHNRAEYASTNKADFFISIHCNANPNKTIQGTETYLMGPHKDQANFEVIKRENSAILFEEDYKEHYDNFDPESPESYILFNLTQNAFMKQSYRLASKCESQFKERVGRTSRGVKQAGFLVLWKSGTPSILIETGFLSNKQEETFLASENGQVFIASAIYRALKEYNSSSN